MASSTHTTQRTSTYPSNGMGNSCSLVPPHRAVKTSSIFCPATIMAAAPEPFREMAATPEPRCATAAEREPQRKIAAAPKPRSQTAAAFPEMATPAEGGWLIDIWTVPVFPEAAPVFLQSQLQCSSRTRSGLSRASY